MTTSVHEHLGLRYLRVAESLKRKVLDGVYQPGERLPRQHDLAKEHNVAFGTLKQALDLLELEGYVDRMVGQGTYARLPEKYTPSALVVDDEHKVGEFVKRFLARCDWNGTAALSGEEALAKLKNGQFDLIILDLVMPGMSGAETFRDIRKVNREIPVVILTAYPDSDLMAQALQVGPFAVMKKPITLGELREVLGGLPRASETATGASRIARMRAANPTDRALAEPDRGTKASDVVPR